MTTETNAVRIQKIKMRSEGLLKYERDYGSDDVNITPIVEDLEWLIQQAERVRELEGHMSMSGRNSLLFSLADCDAENKRLRKALKLVGSDICTEEDREFIVERALKGESV